MRVPTPKNCDVSVKKAIQQLNTKLGPKSIPTYADCYLTDLTATRLIQTNASKLLTSITSLGDYILGTASEIDITDAGDGKVTIGIINPLVVTKGGTGLASTTINQILYSSAANTIAGLTTGNSGVLITSGTGVPSISSTIPTTTQQNITNLNSALTTGLLKVTTATGLLSTAVEGTDYVTPSTLSNYQPLATNLTSLSGLTFVSTSFVKMTSAGTFGLDTNTYLTAETDPVVKALTGIIKSSGTAIGTVTVNSPLDYTTGTLSMPAAATAQNGYLTSTNWNTFNGKADYSFGANNFSGSGTLSAGVITGTSLIKSGGTSSQFLKADGSVDALSYQPLDVTKFAEQHEFIGYGTGYGKGVWSFAAINAGSAAAIVGTANHPGITRFKGSAGVGVIGYGVLTLPTTFLLAGDEETEFVFSLPVINDYTIIRMGFLDPVTNGAPTDGVYLGIFSDSIGGETRNNSLEGTTGSAYQLSAETWYRAKLVVNSDATRVDYYLYDGATGVQLWTDYLTTNIPTATGRETGHGVQALDSSATTANIIDMDYMSVKIGRVLVR